MPRPAQWGPSMWRSLHWVASQYPLAPTKEDEESYRGFFRNLGDVLPCQSCKHHYKKMLRNNDITPYLESRELLSWYVWDLHNKVNRRIGKGVVGYHVVTQNYMVEYPRKLPEHQVASPEPDPRAEESSTVHVFSTGSSLVAGRLIYCGENPRVDSLATVT